MDGGLFEVYFTSLIVEMASQQVAVYVCVARLDIYVQCPTGRMRSSHGIYGSDPRTSHRPRWSLHRVREVGRLTPPLAPVAIRPCHGLKRRVCSVLPCSSRMVYVLLSHLSPCCIRHGASSLTYSWLQRGSIKAMGVFLYVVKSSHYRSYPILYASAWS